MHLLALARLLKGAGMVAGASDCAGCVGVALEVARVAIASPKLQLPAPLMLLLNGGEETVLTAAHGFMQHSSWVKQVTDRCLYPYSSLALLACRFFFRFWLGRQVVLLRKLLEHAALLHCIPSEGLAACKPVRRYVLS